jgi:hypothetical protein
MAVLPSPDRATKMPWSTSDPTAPMPTSLLPCWVQTPPLRVKTHAAQALPPALPTKSRRTGERTGRPHDALAELPWDKLRLSAVCPDYSAVTDDGAAGVGRPTHGARYGAPYWGSWMVAAVDQGPLGP